METAVTVEAGVDSDSVDETETLTVQATGGGYDGLSRDVTVRVRDNDTPGLDITRTEIIVVEDDEGTYTVALLTPADGHG